MEARERVQCCCPPRCTFCIVVGASIRVKHVFFILMTYDCILVRVSLVVVKMTVGCELCEHIARC